MAKGVFIVDEFKRILIRHPNENGGINSLSFSQELSKFKYIKDIRDVFYKSLTFNHFKDKTLRQVKVMSNGEIKM